MTRIDSVRAATDSAKNSVLHAAEVVAPYADTAGKRATHYAREAKDRLGPRVSLAADQARVQYGAHVAPRLDQARSHVPPKVDEAAQQAHDVALRTRKAAERAADYSRPHIERAVAATEPARSEVSTRGAAAIAALRGGVTAKDIEALVRRQERRARAGRVARGVLFAGLLAGGVFAAWKWWDKQANPEWLVEPPAATEVPDDARLTAVDGSAGAKSPLDPEVKAKQDESEQDEKSDKAHKTGRAHKADKSDAAPADKEHKGHGHGGHKEDGAA
ncbi:DUF5324 family protein [Streptomyces sp. NPDC050560]|uniref:DUF5324 family protein n=1 Tax=Streptomyces sp. NPDC050560 TaxID=3365630 RepID=UPI0037949E9B